MLEKKHLKIGKTFWLRPKKEHIGSKSVNQKRKLKIIGLYYEGLNGSSDWNTHSEMISSMKLMVQFSIDGYYIFSNPSNFKQRASEFIKEFNKDLKLLPEHRRYISNEQ